MRGPGAKSITWLVSAIYNLKKIWISLAFPSHIVSNIHMKNSDKKTKKPLTAEEIQDTLKEYREAVELIRTRGLNAHVYGVPSTRRRNRR